MSLFGVGFFCYFFCSVCSDSNRSLAICRLLFANQSSGIYFSLINMCYIAHVSANVVVAK